MSHQTDQHCSFCGRYKDEGERFVQGGPVDASIYICGTCAETAYRMYARERAKELGLRVVRFDARVRNGAKR